MNITAGWYKGERSGWWHWFEENGNAICRGWFIVEAKRPMLPEPPVGDLNICYRCTAKLNALAKKRAKEAKR